jgi:integrase
MKKYKYYTKVLTLADGKRKYVRGKTKKELEEKIAVLKKELDLGINICNTTTFRPYAEQWYKTVKEKDVKPNTARASRARYEKYVYPYIGAMKLRDIRGVHIREVMYQCRALGRGSQSQILGFMRSVFNAAVDDGIVVRSPVPVTLKAGGEDTKEAEWLTDEQEAKLLKAAEGNPVYPFVFLILQTGLRAGEATALMWSDVDFKAGVINVRRHVVPDEHGRPVITEGAKTDAGVRSVPMSSALMAWLKARPKTSLYVIPNQQGQIYSTSYLWQMWRALDKRAGFRTHPHQLRHTFATKLFESGRLDIRQIQTVMGHANPDVTLKVYTHYRAAMRERDTIEQVRAALG